MAEFKVIFDDTNGSVVRVEPPEEKMKSLEDIEIALVTKDPDLAKDWFPVGTFQQIQTLQFIHKPGRSICEIVVGGILFRWC
jgi:hypothetical protein